MTFFDYHNFLQLKVNVNWNTHANFQGERSKTHRDIAEQIFVSKGYFAGKIRHHTVSKTVSCFSETP